MRKRITGALLALALTIPAAAAGSPYQDVPANAWYASAVEYCHNHSLMAETGTSTFHPNGTMTWSMLTPPPAEIDNPNAPITREELAVLLWQQAGSPEGSTLLPFSDASGITPDAVQAVAWANRCGLMTGKPDARFDPDSWLTRAEAATVLMRRNTNAKISPYRGEISENLGANGIAVSSDGTLMVTDLYQKKIWQITNGKAVVFAGGDTVKDPSGEPQGGYHDAALQESYFAAPWAIAPYRNGWAVTDADNNALRFLSNGKVQTLNRSFSHPTGLTADGSGNLYISDTFSGTIRKMDAQGRLTVAATGLSDPMGLCWQNGVLYIAETGKNRIVRLENDTIIPVAGTGTEGMADGSAENAAFSSPRSLTAAEDGTLYISDTGNSAIRRIRNGQVDTIASRNYGAGDLHLIDPSGLLIQGNILLVCDSFARTILEIPVG